MMTAYCQPNYNGDIHPNKFMVVYEDAEMPPSVFEDETEARDHFERAIVNWNCYLFGLLPRSPSPLAPISPADDWSVDCSILAGNILSYLGYSTVPSMEPGSDPRRDKVASMIAAAYEADDAATCEACGASFNVDKDFHTYTHDGVFLCHDCTWTYADMLSEPETFVLDDSGDETVYHTAETAKKIVDEYLASGGSVTDKIGYRAWVKEKETGNAPA